MVCSVLRGDCHFVWTLGLWESICQILLLLALCAPLVYCIYTYTDREGDRLGRKQYRARNAPGSEQH